MNFDLDEGAPIAELVARYMNHAHVFVRRPGDENYRMFDESFRSLRAKQQREWPQLQPEIDALGCAGCDVVNAIAERLDARALVAEHDRALAAVLEALAPAPAV